MEQQQVVPCWCWSTGMLGHEHHHDFPPKEGGAPFGIVFFWGNANGDLTLTWGVGMFLFKSTVTVGTSPMSCYLTINSSSWNFLPPLIFILIKKLIGKNLCWGIFEQRTSFWVITRPINGYNCLQSQNPKPQPQGSEPGAHCFLFHYAMFI